MPTKKSKTHKPSFHTNKGFIAGFIAGVSLVTIGFLIYIQLSAKNRLPPTNGSCNRTGCHMISGKCLCGY